MKKILLASTVLVAASAAAHADVTLSGDARMGIIADKGADAAFTSRARVAFSLSGETDGGLSFGASFRADNASGASSGTAGTVNVSGAFGKLSMGDTDGAAGAAIGQVSGAGLINSGDKNEILYLANGGLDVEKAAGFLGSDRSVGDVADATALYEYTTGQISVYASAANPSGALDAYSVAVKYAADTYSLSLGYETISGTTLVEDGPTETEPGTPGDLSHIVLGATGSFGGASVKAIYALIDGNVDGTAIDGNQYALSVGYKVSGIDLSAFYRVTQVDAAGTSIVDVTASGIGAAYDLGGGAAFKAGAYRASGEKPTIDAGLSFSF